MKAKDLKPKDVFKVFPQESEAKMGEFDVAGLIETMGGKSFLDKKEMYRCIFDIIDKDNSPLSAVTKEPEPKKEPDTRVRRVIRIK